MPGRNNGHYRYTNTVSFFGDSIRAAALDLFTRIAASLAPFIMWPIVAALGVALAIFWPGSIYVLVFLPVAAILLSVLVWVVPPTGFNSTFIHGSVTIWLLTALLFMIDLSGWTMFSIFMMVAAVPLICLSWAVRISVEGKQGQGLEDIFHQAGVPGATMTIHKSNGAKTK
jgi:hypothetical protein